MDRRGRIVPILVIRPIIQIGVIVRIAVGIPVNRPEKLLKKDAMVAMRETPVFLAIKETPVFLAMKGMPVFLAMKGMPVSIKCESRTRREVTANSCSHLERRAGSVRNEPTPKNVTVGLTSGRGRVRGAGERQKRTRYEHSHFHTIDRPLVQRQSLFRIANVIKHRHAFGLVK